MKKTNIIFVLLIVTFQSFSQNETKQSFGLQVGYSESAAYFGKYTLEGTGACAYANYKHDVLNSKFRISPVFQMGTYVSEISKNTKNYKTLNMILNLEYDVIEYKSFNVMLQAGGGVLSGTGRLSDEYIGYLNAGYGFSIGFRYEPTDAPISIVLHPIALQYSSNGLISNLSSLLGLDLHF